MQDEIEKANMMFFAEQAKKGIYIDKIIDLNEKRKKEAYNGYINSIIKANPKEYFIDNKANITINDFTKLSAVFIYEIFGEKYLKDYMELITSKRIITNGSKSILDGVNYVIGSTIDSNFRESGICIPDVHHVSSIITLMHEFSHYLCDKYNYNFNKKYYYGEILSIYAEKRAIEVAEKMFHDNEFKQIVEESRLEGIKWHYTEQKQIVDFLKFMYYNLPVDMNESSDLYTMNPLMANPSDAEYVFKFYEQFAASYGIGYLYSESLIAKRKDDNKKIDNFIDQTIKGEKSLDELLKYFGISMGNNEVFQIADDKIKSIARHK